jgi:hypothetical protein
MSSTANFIAVGLGASSGRMFVGQWNATRFRLDELHRFSNGPVAGIRGEAVLPATISGAFRR